MFRFIFAFCLCSCGGIIAEDQHAAWGKILDPQIGIGTAEGFARSWGPPEKRDLIGASEYWTYFFDHGSTTKTVCFGYGICKGKLNHKYEKALLEFQNGKLNSWRLEVNE